MNSKSIISSPLNLPLTRTARLFDGIVNLLFAYQQLYELYKFIMPMIGETAYARAIQAKRSSNHLLRDDSFYILNFPDLGFWRITYFGDILDFAEAEKNTSQSTLDVCRFTLGWIEYGFCTLRQSCLREMMLQNRVSISSTVPPEFTALLRSKFPLAIAAWARYLLLEMVVKDAWWCTAGNLERKLECLASFMPDDWMWAMDLPMQIARGEIDLIEFALSDRWKSSAIHHSGLRTSSIHSTG